MADSGFDNRLKIPTAFDPSARGLAHTSIGIELPAELPNRQGAANFSRSDAHCARFDSCKVASRRFRTVPANHRTSFDLHRLECDGKLFCHCHGVLTLDLKLADLDPATDGSAQFAPPPNRKDLDLTVSVIICTLHRPAFLRKCLEAVASLHPAADEVLVVDNTQGDQETEGIARSFSARYIVEPTAGLSYARNRGLAESSSDVVAFIDDDAIPNEDWLGFLLEPFKDSQVAAATGRIVPLQSRSVEGSQEARSVSRKDTHWFEIATFGGLGRGCNMALRRAACSGWTAFDERLGRGAPFQIAEENYAFASLLSLGYSAVYLPSAIVKHAPHTHRSVDQVARNSFAYWLLLFSEFPARRFDLLRFLFRRLLRKPLEWPRDCQDPGEIITSGWRVQIKAGFSALLLFLRTKRPKRNKD